MKKNYTSAFKAKLVLELLKGEKSLSLSFQASIKFIPTNCGTGAIWP
jgi:hypothetical protein